MDSGKYFAEYRSLMIDYNSGRTCSYDESQYMEKLCEDFVPKTRNQMYGQFVIAYFIAHFFDDEIGFNDFCWDSDREFYWPSIKVFELVAKEYHRDCAIKKLHVGAIYKNDSFTVLWPGPNIAAGENPSLRSKGEKPVTYFSYFEGALGNSENVMIITADDLHQEMLGVSVFKNANEDVKKSYVAYKSFSNRNFPRFPPAKYLNQICQSNLDGEWRIHEAPSAYIPQYQFEDLNRRYRPQIGSNETNT